MAVEINNIKGVLIVAPEFTGGISESNREWKKCTCVFDIAGRDGRNDNVMAIAFNKVSDRIENMALKKGDELDLTLSVRSRKYNGKYYTDVNIVDAGFIRGNYDDTQAVLKQDEDIVFVSDNDTDLPF